MYYGSRYCVGCKYNRDCYKKASIVFGYHDKNSHQCIIMQNLFMKEYEKENNKEE